MTALHIFSLAALRQIERQASAAGLDLMTRAAHAIKDWVSRHALPGCRILVAAGPGNNGGDALLAAQQLLAAGYLVDILLPRPVCSHLAQIAQDTLTTKGIGVLTSITAPHPAWELIIDGLFGIGLTRTFNDEWVKLIGQLNELGLPILAIDSPTGLDCWTGNPVNACIRAQYTLTFLCHKPGLFMSDGADLAGSVELATLDVSSALLPAAAGEVNRTAATALRRHRNSHKGLYGTVVIEGGAASMSGAALLAGRAALLAGAGKVHIVLLADGLVTDPLHPELMLHNTHAPQPDGDILALGPGLGQSSRAQERLEKALAHAAKLVLDADALNLIAASPLLTAHLSRRQEETILTPHPAEAARLLATDTLTVQQDRLKAARTLARQFKAIVVLKGIGTLIVRPDGYFRINLSGGPALAAAGQGDVLTGLIAALWAQRQSAFDAASLATRVHGLAADEYTQQHGGPIGLTASETASRASKILNRLLSEN